MQVVAVAAAVVVVVVFFVFLSAVFLINWLSAALLGKIENGFR